MTQLKLSRTLTQTCGFALAALVLVSAMAPTSAHAQDFPDGRTRRGERDRDDRNHGDNVGLEQRNEIYLSKNVNLEVTGNDRYLSLTRLIDARARGAYLNNLLLVASSRRGLGQIELVINGERISTVNVSEELGPVTFRVSRMLGNDIRSIDLRTNGRIKIASVGVTLEGSSINPNDPWDPIDPPTGPVEPLPPQPAPRQDIALDERIAGIYESGTYDSDRAIALNDYNARCAAWKTNQEQVLGDRIRELSCGTLVQTGGDNGYRYESTARVVFVSYTAVKTFNLGVSSFYESGTYDSDRTIALNDYNVRCAQLRKDLAQSRVPVLYFSCGTLDNKGGDNGYRFASEARIVVEDVILMREQKNTVVGIYESGSYDSDRGIALKSYEDKCNEWKNDILRYNSTRAILVTCGKIENVGGDNGYQFKSDALAILIDE